MLRVRPLSGRKHRHKKRPDQQRQGKAVFNIEIGGTGVLSTAALTCYAWWAFFMPMAVLTSCCQLGHASPYDSHHCVVLFSGRPQSGSRSVSPPPCASLVRYLVGCLIGYLVRYLAGCLLAASSAAQFATSQAASLTALLVVLLAASLAISLATPLHAPLAVCQKQPQRPGSTTGRKMTAAAATAAATMTAIDEPAANSRRHSRMLLFLFSIYELQKTRAERTPRTARPLSAGPCGPHLQRSEAVWPSRNAL